MELFVIGLNTFLGRGFGNDFNNWGNRDFSGNIVAEQNVSELRKDVAGVNTTVEALGNELQGVIFNLNSGIQTEFRNLDNQICDVEKTQLQSSYAQSLQGFQNTQAIQNQITAFQVANDAKFCNLENQIHADGDATRALINSIEMQNLRDALEAERRGRAEREIEINITNTNQQMQAQLQQQNQFLAGMFGNLSDQVNKATNSVVNLGTMVGNAQSATQSNTKVNS